MNTDTATLQARLDHLLRMAKNNERKQRNFQEYELLLLQNSGLDSLLALILEQHQHRFQLSAVTLLLWDPEYEIRRLLADTNAPSWPGQLLFTESYSQLQCFFGAHLSPRLTLFRPESQQRLFPNHDELASVALLPLVREQQLIGCLNLGSRNPNRFDGRAGTQFLEHLAAVISACLENARLQDKVRQLGLRDPLTGINNRRFFEKRLTEEVSRAQRNASPLSCLFIDLDFFKQVNDQHGHPTGDQVLSDIAATLAEGMRDYDVLARFGGEEFVILLTDTHATQAAEIGERLRQTVANQTFTAQDNRTLQVTLSIGVATMHAESDITSMDALLQNADSALYQAKNQGRNRLCQASVR